MSVFKTLSLRNLRIQLTLWFGGLLLVTMACVALYVGHIASQEIMRTAGETLAVSTRASAELLASNLGEREREIELLRQVFEYEDEISNLEARLRLEQLRAVKAGYAWIGLTDAHGNIVQATDGLLVGENARERPWFKGAFNGLYVGDIHAAVMLEKLLFDPENDQPMRFIDIAVPIEFDNGDIAGVLAAHLHWNWVTDVVKSILQNDRMLQDGELMIADGAGTVLYPEKHAASMQLPASLDHVTQYANLLWPDGKRYLTSVASVGQESSIDLGWRVITRKPIETTTEAITELQIKLLWLGGLAFLVFVLIAYRISRRLTRPIESLVQVARTIEQKPRQVKFPKDSGSPELTALNQALESMTTSLLDREQELENLNASLETQVETRTDELRQANHKLQVLARTDPLTGLLNRRRFEEQLHEHHQHFLQTHIPYSVLMLDADHFKTINDRFGHQTGDQVLQAIGKLVVQATRTTDICGRYGGEEFIILVPALANPNEGKDLAERIRELVAQTEFPGAGRVTVSVGVSQSYTADTSPETVIARADAALYQAKAQGRNQVAVQPEPR